MAVSWRTDSAPPPGRKTGRGRLARAAGRNSFFHRDTGQVPSLANGHSPLAEERWERGFQSGCGDAEMPRLRPSRTWPGTSGRGAHTMTIECAVKIGRAHV